MKGVYYNEHDPYAAEWLEALVKEGHLPAGEVDRRSIVDVRASDLRGFVSAHWFAGIGGWPLALRMAGWPDDRPVWTGSCPCQPFSDAGKKGGFEDERHLWPVWFKLIAECRPDVILGEQVASKDGLGWLDAVLADLEGAGYACGALDICAAGVGAPHIRQRLWLVATRLELASRVGWVEGRPEPSGRGAVGGRGDGGLDDGVGARLEGQPQHGDRAPGRSLAAGSAPAAGDARGLADAGQGGREVVGAPRVHGAGQSGDDDARRGEALGLADAESLREHPDEPRRDCGEGVVVAGSEPGRDGSDDGEPLGLGHAEQLGAGRDAGAGAGAEGGAPLRSVGDDARPSGAALGLADAAGEQRDAGRLGAAGDEPGSVVGPARHGAATGDAAEQGGTPVAAGAWGPGPVNGQWRAADWLFCRDGKWRPVEPGAQQMADGLSVAVGSLRADPETREALTYAARSVGLADQVVRALRRGDAPQAVWYSLGRCVGLPEATLLLAVVCEQSRELGVIFDCAASRSPQEREAALRAVRAGTPAPACPPQGPGHPQQHEWQPGDALSQLSQAYPSARGHVDALRQFTGSPLAHGVPSRVGRLRAYGNAIVPQVAAEIIEALMETIE